MSTTADTATGSDARYARSARTGISFFGPPAEAPLLHETDTMSMPEFDPAATEAFTDWAMSGGHVVKVLYREGDMSLIWSWFAPGYALPRHSHSADCLYFVVAGEARMGSRTVPAGAGFFVPADAPYAYSAGPEGIQVLEFRGATSFDMKITEGLDRWARIAEEARTHADEWRDLAHDVT